MTMIESVAVRQQGAFNFETHYDNLCALQGSCPLGAVKAHLSEGVLDLNGDRIRASDWMPIVNSLRINKTIEFVAFRSYYQNTLDEQEKQGIKLRTKAPSIRSKEITFRLCKALKECLTVTPALTCIELQGLPLRERDLQALARGVAKNSTLKHLSLEHSTIGDEGLEILCKGIKNSKSLTSVNFTGCGLSWKGADALAKIIKHQAIKRHNEAWQDSLRYRRPDLDRMSGIRRITINSNAMLGDQGALALAEALKDDLWLKALDLQQCGLTDLGAKSLLEVLKYNTTIVVMDLRQNPMIDQELLRNIMEQVMINCNGQDTEYKWIKAEPLRSEDEDSVSKSPSRARSKKRIVSLQSNFGKKTTIKVSSSNANRRRSRSTPSRPSQGNAADIKPGPGMPWRTALRANRYRGFPPESQSPTSERRYETWSESSSPLSSPKARGKSQSSVHIEYTTEDGEESSTEIARISRGGGAARQLDLDRSEDEYRDLKEVKVELEQLRRRLKEESDARARAEKRVLELTLETTRLRQEVETSQLRQSILDDDRVLDSIEQSFQQFHAFLDLLRDAGLGQLISLAGIDQTSMPFAKAEPSLHLDGVQPPVSLPGPIPVSMGITLERGDSSLPRELTACLSDRETNHKVQIGIPLHNQSDSALSMSLMPGSRSQAPKDQVIHSRPDNYQLSEDPTTKRCDEVAEDTTKTSAKFDELYNKVLKETEGVLSNAHGDSNLMGSDTATKPKSSRVTRSIPGGDTSSRYDDSHSQKSRHSEPSHQYKAPLSKKSEVSAPPEEMPSKDSTLEAADLDPDGMIQEHQYSESLDEDISEDIEELDEVIDAPDNSPSKKSLNSDEEDF